jgi:hypothetical protein
MKWYKPIPCDNAVKHPLVCDYDNLNDFGFEEEDFLKGVKITNWVNGVVFKALKEKNDGDPDDVLQSRSMLPIYSKRLIEELNSQNLSGIQFLPVEVVRRNCATVDGFAIANFTNFIAALNYEKSEFIRFSLDFPNPNVRGTIAGITKNVINPDKLVGLDVFRLKDYEPSFFVSERFIKIFELNKFTGYSFDLIELNDA